MTRSSLTRILLGGALAAACSKPNPLFLDTWGGATDSGVVSETSATTVTTAPGTWTTATSSGSTEEAPPTTSTATTWTPTSSSSDTEDTETTAEPACTKEELELAPAHDTFVVTKMDAHDVCNLDGEEFKANYCKFLDFGQRGWLASFRGEDELEPSLEAMSAYVFRFPRDGDGLLLESGQGPAIPLAELVKVNLRIAYSRAANAEMLESVTFQLYAIPPGASWVEGSGAGGPCVEREAQATFTCSQCASGSNCVADWFGGEFDLGKLNLIEEFEADAPTPEGTVHHRGLDNKWFGEEDNEGFVLVATGVNEGAPVLPGMVRLHAKEYAGDAELRPMLRVEVCK